MNAVYFSDLKNAFCFDIIHIQVNCCIIPEFYLIMKENGDSGVIKTIFENAALYKAICVLSYKLLGGIDCTKATQNQK